MDLPSREAIVERIAKVSIPTIGCECGGAQPCEACRLGTESVIDSLTLLDLAAEMKRRGATVVLGPSGIYTIVFAPQQKDNSE